MTKRLAIIGAVASAIVLIATLTQPADPSRWPPLVAAVTSAAVAFLWVWLFLPMVAYLGSLVLKAIRMVFRWATRPISSTPVAKNVGEPRSSGDIPAR